MKLNIGLFVNVCHLINGIEIIRPETHHWQYNFRRAQLLSVDCYYFVVFLSFVVIFLYIWPQILQRQKVDQQEMWRSLHQPSFINSHLIQYPKHWGIATVSTVLHARVTNSIAYFYNYIITKASYINRYINRI